MKYGMPLCTFKRMERTKVVCGPPRRLAFQQTENA
jgi:hypothetical protein